MEAPGSKKFLSTNPLPGARPGQGAVVDTCGSGPDAAPRELLRERESTGASHRPVGVGKPGGCRLVQLGFGAYVVLRRFHWVFRHRDVVRWPSDVCVGRYWHRVLGPFVSEGSPEFLVRNLRGHRHDRSSEHTGGIGSRRHSSQPERYRKDRHGAGAPAVALGRVSRGSHLPGTYFYYTNFDFNVLGTIFEQQVGHGIFEEFQERIAKPLGMEDYLPGRCFYQYELDKSMHPAYHMRMSARDLARYGQLYID